MVQDDEFCAWAVSGLVGALELEEGLLEVVKEVVFILFYLFIFKSTISILRCDDRSVAVLPKYYNIQPQKLK